MKTLLITGCSYGRVYSEIESELKEIFDVDKVVNLSSDGASPDRQIRVVIEWIAQNGKPDMVIMPVSHSDRFDLPIAKDFDPLHNLHARTSWSNNIVLDGLNDEIDKDIFDKFLKYGAMIYQIQHPTHDYLFVKLITFQAYLETNKIRHLIFDTGNYYEKMWMKYLSIDEKNNSGYQPGMRKRDLIENCPGIYKFFSFCSNVWMYEQMTEEEQKNLIAKYSLNEYEQATLHHHKEQVIQLMKHLKKEGAVHG